MDIAVALDRLVAVPVWLRIGDAEPEQVGEIAVAFTAAPDPDDPARIALRSTDPAGIRGQVADVLESAAAKLRERDTDEGGTDAAAS